MSTRACIARTDANGWSGRYHHSDGYPTHLGRVLFNLYRKHFHSDAEAMLKFLLDDHKAGWSFLGSPVEAGGVTDYNMPAGYVNDYQSLYQKGADGRADFSKPIVHGPICLCHGDCSHPTNTIRSKDDPSGLEWAYVISPALRFMYVYQPDYSSDSASWKLVSTVNLDGPEPDWTFVECGEKLERCGHYAWRHFPELRDTVMSRLGTAKFLGETPLDVDDACAFEIKGVRYEASGTGSQVTSAVNGTKLWAMLLHPPAGHSPLTPHGAKAMHMRHGPQQYPDGSFYYPVYGYKQSGGYKQIAGVTPIYPPTLKQPLEVFAAIRAAQGKSDANQPAQDQALEKFLTNRRFRDEEV